jgi:hypothetical protein
MTSSDRSPHADPNQRELDFALLRRFEPQLRFNRGELFRPMDIDTFLRHTDLVSKRKRETPVTIAHRPDVTQDTIAACDHAPADGRLYLQLVDRTLSALQMVGFHSRSELRQFRKGIGRHARVGLAARFLDAAFRVSLVARGRVPGGTAAAAAVAYQDMLETSPFPVYYGRVVRTGSYTALQYWFFYAYNDYRSHYQGANDHEGDWEHVTVYLDEQAPAGPEVGWVAYASHDSRGADFRRRWDDPELARVGEHPIVYVGAGSHASFFSPGEYVIRIRLPLLSTVSAVVATVRSVWHTVLRQGGVHREPSEGELDIAFVDYARGDGMAVGPGGDQEWDARLLVEQPGLLYYRGLWGRYSDDAFRGEDAPAGPRFERDGSVRTAWFDPVGFAELTAVPPASREVAAAEEEVSRLKGELTALEPMVAAAETEALRLGLRVETLRDGGSPGIQLDECMARLEAARADVHRLRGEASEAVLLTRAMEQRLTRLRAGDRGDPRAHLQHPAVPYQPSQLRLHRFAETWSAISAGLLLVLMSASIVFYRESALPLMLLFAAFLFVESLFHRRVAALVHGIVMALTFATLAVLIYEFWWQTVVGIGIALGLTITWVNLRELTRR